MHSVSALVLLLFVPASSQYSSGTFFGATGYLEVVRFGFGGQKQV